MTDSLAKWPQEFCEWVSGEPSMESRCVVQASSPLKVESVSAWIVEETVLVSRLVSLPQLLLSCSVVSDFLQPCGLQQARLPCPSSSPGVCSNSCPQSWQWHSTISSPGAPSFFCLQSFLISGSFPVSQLFTSDDQSIEASASVSVFPMNIQGWFPLGWTGLISLLSKGLSRVFSSTTIPPPGCLINISWLQLSCDIRVRVRIRVRVSVRLRVRARVSHLPKAVQLTGDRASIWTQGVWLKPLCS